MPPLAQPSLQRGRPPFPSPSAEGWPTSTSALIGLPRRSSSLLLRGRVCPWPCSGPMSARWPAWTTAFGSRWGWARPTRGPAASPRATRSP
eukprot:411909-Alexandrium_andersonii.AAC.1